MNAAELLVLKWLLAVEVQSAKLCINFSN